MSETSEEKGPLAKNLGGKMHPREEPHLEPAFLLCLQEHHLLVLSCCLLFYHVRIIHGPGVSNRGDSPCFSLAEYLDWGQVLLVFI